MAEPLILFRVHFEDGTSHDVHAATPEDARKRLEDTAAARETIITKIKKVKGGHDGR
jgi:hypothetical protein